jgi:hypothetical protein
MVYYVYNVNKLDEQCMGGEYICYKHNCIFIPKNLDKRYKISNYYYSAFNIKSLFKIESGTFKKITHIRIEIFE